MKQPKHINMQIVGTPDDRKRWKAIAAECGVYLGEWVRNAIDAQIAAQTVYQNAQSPQSNAQMATQIEAVTS